MKANEGIGGWLSDLEVDSDGNPYQNFRVGRFMFDFLYNLIIKIIIISIFAGLIIDTFGSLREE